jgi:hypothetical protein
VPTPVPTAPPKAAPKAQAFVVGDYIFSGKVANEFSASNTTKSLSYDARAGLEIPVSDLGFLVEADARQWTYPHDAGGGACPGDPGCVTVIGSYGQTYVPAFIAKDQDLDGRVGIGIPIAKLYLDVAYLRRTFNYGYPAETGVGYGLERLPDLNQPISLFGSFIYYPQISGNYTDSPPSPYAGTSWKLEYRVYQYQVGLTLGLGKSPLFIEAGFLGDRGQASNAAPSSYTHSAINAGLGLHI